MLAYNIYHTWILWEYPEGIAILKSPWIPWHRPDTEAQAAQADEAVRQTREAEELRKQRLGCPKEFRLVGCHGEIVFLWWLKGISWWF